MSLADCISRWPTITRCPWFGYSLLPAQGSSTDARASFTCRNSGSFSSAMNSITEQFVPTLPTPTTLTARSQKRKRSNSVRTCSGRLWR
jgi:hypothetical protein